MGLDQNLTDFVAKKKNYQQIYDLFQRKTHKKKESKLTHAGLVTFSGTDLQGSSTVPHLPPFNRYIAFPFS